jgi:hypothetical protein
VVVAVDEGILLLESSETLPVSAAGITVEKTCLCEYQGRGTDTSHERRFSGDGS